MPVAVCGHELCVKCALDLCSVIKSYDVPGIAGTIPCPLCRSGIASFRRRAVDEDEPDVNAGGGRRRRAGDHQASSSPEKKRSTDSDQEILPFFCAPPAVMS